ANLLTLESRLGTEDDAVRLFAAWSVLTPTGAEQAAFRRAYFDEARAGEDSEMGRRTATLALARMVVSNAPQPIDLGEIRRAMVYGRLANEPAFSIPA